MSAVPVCGIDEAFPAQAGMNRITGGAMQSLAAFPAQAGMNRSTPATPARSAFPAQAGMNRLPTWLRVLPPASTKGCGTVSR